MSGGTTLFFLRCLCCLGLNLLTSSSAFQANVAPPRRGTSCTARTASSFKDAAKASVPMSDGGAAVCMDDADADAGAAPGTKLSVALPRVVLADPPPSSRSEAAEPCKACVLLLCVVPFLRPTLKSGSVLSLCVCALTRTDDPNETPPARLPPLLPLLPPPGARGERRAGNRDDDFDDGRGPEADGIPREDVDVDVVVYYARTLGRGRSPSLVSRTSELLCTRLLESQYMPYLLERL